MANFRVFNVRGDGNCFYRCMWRIGKEDRAIADALWIFHLDDEDAGSRQVRRFVANALLHCPRAERALQNLMALRRAWDEDVDDLEESYPILEHLDPDLDSSGRAWSLRKLSRTQTCTPASWKSRLFGAR